MGSAIAIANRSWVSPRIRMPRRVENQLGTATSSDGATFT
jgi:hypothetical protein